MDYQEDLQVKPALDLNNSIQQAKVQKAQALLQFGMQNPLIMQSPPHLYEVSKRYLEGIGETDIDRLLPNPMEMQQEMEGKQQEMQGVHFPLCVTLIPQNPRDYRG